MSPLQPRGDKTRKQTFAFPKSMMKCFYIRDLLNRRKMHVKKTCGKSILFPNSCCRFLNTPQKGGSAQEFQDYELCSHLRLHARSGTWDL